MNITSNKMTQSLIQNQLLIANEQFTNKQTIQAYLQALAFSNLTYGHELHTRNVRIYGKQHYHQIYTNNPPGKSLPHLVMLHGFGGIALNFIRTFEHLMPHYQVHALDMFGIGLSSVGNYSQKFTYEQTKHYFVDSLQEWRKTLNIKQFTLVGHSFGGYVATLYSEKYPGNIKRLVLLSPAGTTSKTQQQLQADIERRKSNSFGSKVFMCLAEKIYNINVRPSSIINSCVLGNTFIEKITSGRLRLKDAEKQAWKKYLKAICRKTNSSETGFYKLFDWPVQPKKPIEQIIKTNNFKFPIEFYFGSVDWMDRTGAVRLCKTQKNVICEIIQEAGHQLVFDNPLAVVSKILRQNRCDKPKKQMLMFLHQ